MIKPMQTSTLPYTIEVGPEDRRHRLVNKGRLVEIASMKALRNFLRNRSHELENPVVLQGDTVVEINL